ncbi:hypothetical protein AU074_22015 [Pseudomonas sp. ATCC PTA-122608]|nr:hypothetical protein AU074_22015 [Pseudomonas sp. ATCC PTA-122608]
MQMKRTLTPGSNEFKEAVGLAWLDFVDPSFNKDLDKIQIVFDSSSLGQMKGAQQIVAFARSTLTHDVWKTKVNAKNFSNEKNRKAYDAIEGAVKNYDLGAFSDDRFHGFVKSIEFLGESLDSDNDAGTNTQKQLISQQLPSLDKNMVWARLVSVCVELNGVAGEISLSNLNAFMPELVDDFGIARLLLRAMSTSTENGILEIKQHEFYEKLQKKLLLIGLPVMSYDINHNLSKDKPEFASLKLSSAISDVGKNQARIEQDGVVSTIYAKNKGVSAIKKLTNDSIGEILNSWFPDHEHTANTNHRFIIQELQCELFAANIQTGELSEERFETTAYAEILVSTGEDPLLKREYKLWVSGRGHDELEVTWQFSFNMSKQKDYFARSKHFSSSFFASNYFREKLNAYEKVLEKILAGWKPVVRLGLPEKKEDQFHNDLGLISNIPRNDELLEMSRRIKVINLILNLAEKNSIHLRFSDAAFDKLLTEELIVTAVQDLVNVCTPYPPNHYRSAAYVQGDNWEICMVARNFFIGFQKFQLQKPSVRF